MQLLARGFFLIAGGGPFQGTSVRSSAELGSNLQFNSPQVLVGFTIEPTTNRLQFSSYGDRHVCVVYGTKDDSAALPCSTATTSSDEYGAVTCECSTP